MPHAPVRRTPFRAAENPKQTNRPVDRRLSALLASVLVALLATASQAQQATLTDDSTYPAGVSSNQALLIQGASAVKGQPATTAYVRFKITGSTSQQMGDIPSGTPGADVKKATLRLFVSGVTATGKFNVYRVTGSWTEDGTTAPTYDTANPVAANVTVPAVNSYFSIDVTPLVKQWLDCESQAAGSPCGNYGLAFVPDPSTPTMSFSFDSKEGKSTSHQAQLTVLLDHVAVADRFTGSLDGDVTGTQSATVVSSVGGQSAGDVAAAAAAVNASTENGVGGTLVRRDAYGNFSANKVTADVAGNVTGNLTGNVAGDVVGNLTGNVTGNVSGNAGSVTNGVYTVGDQTVGGTKTFTSPIVGSVTGSASSITGTLDGAKVTGSVALADIATSVRQYANDPAPDAANAGQIILNTTSNHFKISDGAQWKVIGSYVARAESAAVADTANALAPTATVQAGQVSGALTNATISGNQITALQVSQSQVTNLTSDLAAKANDSGVVHLAGAETVSGQKNFQNTQFFSGRVGIGMVTPGANELLRVEANTGAVAGWFVNNHNTSNNDALYALHTGFGNAVHGRNTQVGGRAGFFETGHANNSAAALEALSLGVGPAFKASNNGTGLAGLFVGNVQFNGGLQGPNGSGGATGGSLSLGAGNGHYPGGTTTLRAGGASSFYGGGLGPYISLTGNDYNSGGDITIASGHSVAGAASGVITLNANGASGGGQSPGHISLQIAGAEHLRVAGDGKVGVGISAPQSRLHVAGTVQIEGAGSGVKFADGTVQTTAASSGLATVSHDATLSGAGTGASPLGVASIDGSKVTGTVANATTAASVTGTVSAAQVSGALTDATIGGDRVTGNLNITGNGAVSGALGVGTATPQSKFHVSGTMQGAADNLAQITGTGGGQLLRLKSNDQWAANLVLSSNTRDWVVQSMGNGDAQNGNLLIFDKTANATRMTFNPSGNVGVGVNAPQSKLHVAGSIQMDGSSSGLKFADGTVQTTAATSGLASVAHDSTLSGTGASGSPLSVASVDASKVTGTVASAATAASLTGNLDAAQVSGKVASAATADTANALAPTANVLGSQVSGAVTLADVARSVARYTDETEPAAEASNAGHIILNTTSNALKVSDGAAWKVIGSSVAHAATADSAASLTGTLNASQVSGKVAASETADTANALAPAATVPASQVNGTVASATTAATANALAASATVNASQVTGALTNATLDGSNLTGDVNASTKYSIDGDTMLSSPGTQNIFAGRNAGSSNTTGSSNSFFGTGAGTGNVTGSSNSFFGYLAGKTNSTGDANSFFGVSAGNSNTTGSNNSFFGYWAGVNSTTGIRNSFFGQYAGRENTSGNNNSFVGLAAGNENTTGSGNVAVGWSAGNNNTTGSHNTFIGTASGTTPDSNFTNATAIGYQALVAQSNSVVLGNNASVGIGTSAPQSRLHVVGTVQIEGTGSGVKFADGTTQTTAATSGLASVAHDSTLTGTGASGSPLGVATIDASKVTGKVASAATADSANALAASATILGTQVNGNISGKAATAGVADSANALTPAAIVAGSQVSGKVATAGTADTANTLASSATISGGQVSGALTNTTIDGSKLTGNINASTQYSIAGLRVLSSSGSNLFAGGFAGDSHTTGSGNSFFGIRAGNSNTSGNSNSFFGVSAGLSNTTATGNSFFGSAAGSSNTTGHSNSFFGSGTGTGNTTGYFNSFIGHAAGQKNNGIQNSAIGTFAGANNTTGSNNTFVGYGAGSNNTVEDINTFLGAQSNGAAGITNATALGYGAFVQQSNSVVLGNNANVGIGTGAPKAKLHVQGGQVYVNSPGQGITLKSPDGTKCATLTIDNAGALAVTAVTCP